MDTPLETPNQINSHDNTVVLDTQEVSTVKPSLQLKQLLPLLLVGVVLLLAGVSSLAYNLGKQQALQNVPQPILPVQTELPEEVGIACTLDAKICPDGSAVGRVPPSCEFEACLETTTPSVPNGWKTVNDPNLRIAVSYPQSWEVMTSDSNPYMVSFKPDSIQQPKHFSASFMICVERSTGDQIPCDLSFEQTLNSQRAGFASYEETEVIIDGVVAKQFKGVASDNQTNVITTIVPVGDYYFQFVLMNGESLTETYQDMVKTLHFIK